MTTKCYFPFKSPFDSGLTTNQISTAIQMTSCILLAWFMKVQLACEPPLPFWIIFPIIFHELMCCFSDDLALSQFDDGFANDGACVTVNGSVVPHVVASFIFSVKHYHRNYGDAYWSYAFNNYAPPSPD